MIFYISVFFCFVTYILFRHIFLKKKSANSKLKAIPCESGLPIIGIIRDIENPLCNYLMKLGKKHGPIYRVKFGMRDIVVLNTFEYIKAGLLENGDAFSGRWKAQNVVTIAKNSGLVLIDGNVWAEQRSFVLKTLKDFGFGRSRSMEIIIEECEYLLKDMEHLIEKPVNLSDLFSIYTLNVISKFVMNRRFTHGDPGFKIFVKFMDTVANVNDPLANLSLMFPFLEENEWLWKFLTWITSRKLLVERCYSIFEKAIKEHLSELDFNSDGDDLMDRFLIKQHQMKERDGNVETFTDFQLVRNSLELLMAGYDTTSTLLEWGLMFMAMYQDVQRKIYEEINDIIGSERFITMGNKVSLNYTQAVIDEISRLTSVLPLSIMHRTLADVSVKGYFIPKDTLVLPNIFACHLDPHVWEKPFEFHPEHFLVTEINGRLKYQSREELIHFGIGKRQCLGESLARMEIFIFFTNILQRFHVRLAKEEDPFDVFRSNDGVVRKPYIHDFILERRKQECLERGDCK